MPRGLDRWLVNRIEQSRFPPNADPIFNEGPHHGRSGLDQVNRDIDVAPVPATYSVDLGSMYHLFEFRHGGFLFERLSVARIRLHLNALHKYN